MRLGDVLSALACPSRRKVVAVLAAAPEGTERPCTSFGLPVTKATLTHHFKILREAGLIRQVDRGNSHMAHLRFADLETRFPGLLALVLSEPER